jgi:hypothetical protein
MNNDLLANLDRIHTTKLGAERIRKNLSLDIADVIEWCKPKILNASNIIKEGKNWYVHIDDFILTINAYSLTIITAHKIKHSNK